MVLVSARNASSREAVEDQKDPLEYAGGEFDNDEPVELVTAARQRKKPAVVIRGKQVSMVHLTTPSSVLVTSFKGQPLSRLSSQLPLRCPSAIVVSRKLGIISPHFPFLVEQQAPPTPATGESPSNRRSFIGLQHLKTHSEQMPSWRILSRKYGRRWFPPLRMK